MKKLKTIVTILILSLILVGMTSCEISRHAENRRHRGWFHRQDEHREHKDAILIITPEIKNNNHKTYDQD